jgi:hypothetical protein
LDGLALAGWQAAEMLKRHTMAENRIDVMAATFDEGTRSVDDPLHALGATSHSTGQC